MAGEIKLNDVSVATESGGTVTIAPNNVTFAANHAGIKTALNASGSAPIYACRAWVNFNGTGTVAIRESGNVSSITDNGTGDYTVNFVTAMPDANYAAHWSMECSSNSSGWLCEISNYTTTSVRLVTRPYSSGNFDSPTNSVSIFR